MDRTTRTGVVTLGGRIKKLPPFCIYRYNTHMTREEALVLMQSWTPNLNLQRHMLAVEAQMKALAHYFGEDEQKWGLVGLLHDADYEMFKDNPKMHPSKIAKELEERGTDPTIIQAIKAHAWGWREDCPKPITKMDWAIYTCDELSGFIIACALVKPEKKLSTVTVETVLKKWPDKAFAKGVVRENIELCEKELGVKLVDYIQICLDALQKIAPNLGL